MPELNLEKLSGEKLEAVYRAGLQEFSSKPFSDASTDNIAAVAGISKGLLFHYFKSKKGFYMYCLKRALDSLTQPVAETGGGDFYQILFNSMRAKLDLCTSHMPETMLVNMASRDASRQIAQDKTQLIGGYTQAAHRHSQDIMARALACLKLKDEQQALALSGLTLYSTALINRYLLTYQQRPEEFFAQADRIEREFRAYIDLMLKGIEREEEK